MTEKKFKFQFTRKYFFDGLLIVFSVLFALFINKIAENIEKFRDKNEALENIRMEIQRNHAVIEEWKVLHNDIKDRLSGIVAKKNDTLRAALLKNNYLNVGLLTNGQSLITATLTKTAWETTKTTGIISEFDFDTTQKLTEVYILQDAVMDKTLMKAIDFLFDPSAHDMQNLDATLIQLQLRFWELTGQENLLADLYENVLKELDH